MESKFSTKNMFTINILSLKEPQTIYLWKKNNKNQKKIGCEKQNGK